MDECTIPNELIELEEAQPSESLASIQDLSQSLTSTWKIYVDGSSNSKGLKAGIVIATQEGIIFEHALCLEFPATNNEVEYKAIIIRLEVAKELEVQDLKVYSNTQVIVGHMKGNCMVREENMVKYLQKVRKLTHAFDNFEIQ